MGSENVIGTAPHVEARHATVLRCDLESSTETKRRLDLEGQVALRQSFERVVAEAAGRYGAHVEPFEGDGAMLVLGDSVQAEDSAESAVRMGLDLVRAITETEIVPNVPMRLRVGIASGLMAVVGPPEARGGRFAGVTIDLAERLRALAEPGQVVIADGTQRLAAGFFRYDDLGLVPVKGFQEGVRAWRVVGESSVPSRFEARRLEASPVEIVGRSNALARLAEAWDRAMSGHGQAVCLVGEAGIGKSRLARAALDAAARDGATVLSIDCMPSTGNTPLFPIAVLLRRTANIASTASEAEKRAQAERLLARALPDEDPATALAYLAPLFGLHDIAIPEEVTPAAVRDRTIALVVGMLSRLAAERPVAVVCEDLHWIDDTTAEVLARTCAAIERLPALVIVTMRPAYEAPPLDLAGFTTIALEPLSPSLASQLVQSVARGVALDEGLVRRIVDQCEGVPLVLEEVTRSVLDAADQGDALAAADADPVSGVPAPLQLVVQSRLGRWPHSTPIVQTAAVLGREFPVALLARVAPQASDAAVGEVIGLLAREGVFDQPDPERAERARFKHMVICEAVYNTLLGSDRQRLHSSVADILASEYAGTSDAAPDVIAEHLRKARRYTESIRLRLATSADTAARGAYVEAEGHCAAALALVDEVADPAERRMLQFRSLIQLGVALSGRHGYSATVVEDVYRRALAVCGGSGEAEMLYPIIRGQTVVTLLRGDLPTAYGLSMQSFQLAEQSRRVEFVIDGMSLLCYTALYYRSLEESRDWIERCLKLYRDEQGHTLSYPVPQDPAAAALALLPTVAWLLGDSQACEQAVADGIEHVERLGHDFNRAFLHAWLAGTRFTQRRYAQSLQHAGTAVALGQRHGFREWEATGGLLALLAQAALAPHPEPVATATAACAAFAAEGVGLNASWYLWALAGSYIKLGDVQTARGLLAEASKRAAASGETRMNAELLILQAEIEADDASAVRLLGEAVAISDAQGAVATVLRALALRSLRSGEDASLAREALDTLDGRRAYPARPGWMAEAASALRTEELAAAGERPGRSRRR